ncbi:MAG: hypothetical protein COV69_02320 [Parcubacteria group bacterium CG11_big_fil_rev_8_21_14_0_20_39_14]|nr:MAG: hypothetical protein COV69_02320 [Parcubacteria group bacterium CG11_big_fil_rev_8_21_14_0_20_39_14]PIS35417.1 MAG: hypothetical protein COT36_02475 [Parcubacteria group bacterium CG08_land_8_20_14_0_20_38_56]
MENYLLENQWMLWLLLLWVMPWKGVALWKASRNTQKFWFILLLLVNTMALLEIVYIFYFSKEKQSQQLQ